MYLGKFIMAKDVRIWMYWTDYGKILRTDEFVERKNERVKQPNYRDINWYDIYELYYFWGQILGTYSHIHTF